MVIYTVLAKKIEKIKKKSKKFKKIKNHRNNFWGPCQVLNIYVCISSLTSQHVYKGAGTSHRNARSLNCDNFGQEQYFLMR